MDLDELQKTIGKIVRDLSDACDEVIDHVGDDSLIDTLCDAHDAACKAKCRAEHLAKTERV